MPQAITLDDLLAAYREAGFSGDVGDDGASCAELCEAWRCGPKSVRRYLVMASKAGLLKTGWRNVQDITGRSNRVPVYSFVKPEKNRKSRTA